MVYEINFSYSANEEFFLASINSSFGMQLTCIVGIFSFMSFIYVCMYNFINFYLFLGKEYGQYHLPQ